MLGPIRINTVVVKGRNSVSMSGPVSCRLILNCLG